MSKYIVYIDGKKQSDNFLIDVDVICDNRYWDFECPGCKNYKKCSRCKQYYCSYMIFSCPKNKNVWCCNDCKLKMKQKIPPKPDSDEIDFIDD